MPSYINTSESSELDLQAMVKACKDDPLKFVLIAYPWDTDPDLQVVELQEPWASRYNSKYGPDKWFCELCDEWASAIENNEFDGKTPVLPFRYAVSSGHGIGKSACSSWIIHFIMSTRPHSKGIVTSNTSDQLRTKTWGELGKWTNKLINKHWFEYNNGKGNMHFYHKENKNTWRVDAQTCREENSESFAGLHCVNSSPWYLFDEASAVPDAIWEVAEGGLTDGEPFWFAFGNPTRNSGRFRECFRKFRLRWINRHVDSRDVQVTNKNQLNTWLSDYGESSDFFKVRVRGVFPSQSSYQKIPTDLLESAFKRNVTPLPSDAKVMSLDLARGGDDLCVFRFRHGLNGKVRKPEYLNKEVHKDTARVVDLAIMLYREFQPDVFFVDGTGGSSGQFADGMRRLGYNCRNVIFSERSPDPKFANMRAYMYDQLLQKLRAGLSLPESTDLLTEIGAIEYGFDRRDREILIPKEEIKKRIGISTDDADALALLFAAPVQSQRSNSHQSDNYDDGRYEMYSFNPHDL